jgi:hypothetical protein
METAITLNLELKYFSSWIHISLSTFSWHKSHAILNILQGFQCSQIHFLYEEVLYYCCQGGYKHGCSNPFYTIP